MDPTRIELFQAMPLFGGLNNATIELLAGDAQQRDLPAGDFFCHQGDQGDELFVLERGRVAVRRHVGGGEMTLRFPRPGDCFCEMAPGDLTPRSASIVAVEDSRALVLPVARLHALYEQDLEQFALIQMNMAREMSRRLRVAMERLGAVYEMMMT